MGSYLRLYSIGKCCSEIFDDISFVLAISYSIKIDLTFVDVPSAILFFAYITFLDAYA